MMTTTAHQAQCQHRPQSTSASLEGTSDCRRKNSSMCYSPTTSLMRSQQSWAAIGRAAGIASEPVDWPLVYLVAGVASSWWWCGEGGVDSSQVVPDDRRSARRLHSALLTDLRMASDLVLKNTKNQPIQQSINPAGNDELVHATWTVLI